MEDTGSIRLSLSEQISLDDKRRGTRTQANFNKISIGFALLTGAKPKL